MRPLPPQVPQVLALAEALLPGQILGMYLYGSATLKQLRPDSDLDILIITAQELSTENRIALTQRLLAISGAVGNKEKRPIELTIIKHADLVPVLSFPPSCQYMYGEWLRAEMEAGYYPQAFSDPDIVLLLWQARTSCYTLRGKDISELIPPIPFATIKKAIYLALPGLMANLKGDERNVLLTLARMWFSLATKQITTKDSAAKWAIARMPEHLTPLLTQARDAYLGLCFDTWESCATDTQALAAYMSAQIETLVRVEAQN